MTRPKVFFVINSLEGGGAERVFTTLLTAFADDPDFGVELVLLDSVPMKYAPPPGLRIHQLDCRQSYRRSIADLVGLVRRERPALVFSFLNRANCAAVMAAMLSGCRAIISERVHTTSHFGAGRGAAVKRLFVRLLYPRADLVVAVSHGIADDLAERYAVPRSRIAVIYNPVRQDHIRTQGALAPASPVSDGPYWLGIGRLMPNKNFALLLRAFAEAKPVGDLVILGEGPERARLEALSRELGIADRVRLPGFVENPFALTSRAHAYLACSNAEGFPNALVEAMVLGTAVASTDCDSGPAEILRGHTAPKVTGMTEVEHGILTPTGDVDAMADAIRRLGDGSVRQRYADAARRRAADFDIDATLAAYRAVIVGALAR